MVSPIDYMLNVRGPLEKSIQGFQLGQASRIREAQEERAQMQEARTAQEFPLSMEQRRQAIDIRGAQEARAAEQFRLQNEAAARNLERQEALRERLTYLAVDPNATASSFAAIMTEFPEVSSDLSRGWDMKSKARQDAILLEMSQVYSAISKGLTSNNNDDLLIAKQLLEERVTAAENAGSEEDARQTKLILGTLNTDPRAAKTMLGLYLNALGGTKYDDLLNESNPSVQSSEIIGGLASVAQMKDGTTRITDVRTGERVAGDKAEALLMEARKADAEIRYLRQEAATKARLGAEAELGAEAAGATAAGETAIEVGVETFRRLGPLEANIANLNAAINLVESEGANSGVLASRLPAWENSTIELRNLQKALGLDVISSANFGALSEGELDVALQVALPTNLSETELADWLRKKRDAQIKLVDLLRQKASFLSTPGRTIDQWIDFLNSGSKSMSTWMRENPIGIRTERVNSSEPAATDAEQTVASDDLQFVKNLDAKRQRGESLSQDDMARLNRIARGE